MSCPTSFGVDAQPRGNPLRLASRGAPHQPGSGTGNAVFSGEPAGLVPRVTRHDTIRVADADPPAHGFQLA
jgi:hypothetical protein